MLVLQGTRGLWLGRAVIGIMATVLLGSLASIGKGGLYILFAPAFVVCCGTIAEIIRALKPYTLHLDLSGVTLKTPFRERSWIWQDYQGIVRVAALIGEKPLAVRALNNAGRSQLILLGKWPVRIEIEIQKYAHAIGVRVPLFVSDL